MTPLFAATQGSFGSGMTQTQESMSVDGPPGLRATQNLQFTPTQDQGRSHDWLNPSQVRVLMTNLCNLNVYDMYAPKVRNKDHQAIIFHL